MEKNNKEKSGGVMEPFKLLRYDKIYWWWVISLVFFGNINIVAALVLGKTDDLKTSLTSGSLYIFAISICAPFVVSFGLKAIYNKRSGLPLKFITYKISVTFVNLIWLFILTFLWLGSSKGLFRIQFLCVTISIIFAFYMFCISEMDNHYTFFEDCDDTTYLSQENKNMKKITKQSKNLDSNDIIEWSEGNAK